MDSPYLFALGITLAWLAGVRVYLTVFGIGLAGALGFAELPAALEICASPMVLAVAGALALIEFFADKLPGVDSIWDLAHTLLRVPAGAFLAAAAIGADSGELSVGALAAGGAVAAGSHALKLGTRALVNLSPEPLSNVAVSTTEDVAAIGALALVMAHPWLALIVIASVGLGLFLVVGYLARAVYRRLAPAKAG